LGNSEEGECVIVVVEGNVNSPDKEIAESCNCMSGSEAKWKISVFSDKS
jgi:hypothetical protein